jgi:hypothetical protein
MLLVVAALAEEVKVVIESAGQVRRIGGAASLFQSRRDGQQFCLLKSGVGPKAAANRLADALRRVRPSLILVVGYAGALKAGLELGDLVAIDRSSLLKKLQPEAIAAGDLTCEGSWELPGRRHRRSLPQRVASSAVRGRGSRHGNSGAGARSGV